MYRAGRVLSVVMLMTLAIVARAQVSLYHFSESVGTYTEISESDGGVTLGVPAYWPQVYNARAWVNNPFNDPGGQVTNGGAFSPAIGPGYPIGFDFSFNGDVFDVIGISNGGWISFGKSTDNLQAVWVYNYTGNDPFPATFNNPTPSYKRNRVAGFGNSGLQQVDWTSLVPPGQYSKLQMATIGTAPNRVCVIQWKDYGMNNDVTVARNIINFQIRLNEIDNSVEVVLGPMTWVSTLGRHIRTQSGLSGRSHLDFNGRMTVYEEPAFLYDWNNTVAADSENAYCQFTVPEFGQPNGSGIPPVNGLTWRWDPPVCAPPAWPLVVSDITFSTAVAQWEANGAVEFEYYLSTENSPTGPEVASDITTETEVAFEELSDSTTYYVFVRSICDGQPGDWSVAVAFETLRGGVVTCNGELLYEDYCSNQYDVQEWLYISGDGSPLRLEFTGGFLGTVSGESLTYWVDAAAGVNMLSGNLTDRFIQAPNGRIRIRLTTQAGACHAQEWYLPIKWRIGCKNCTDPLANFSVVEDCAAQTYNVVAQIQTLGTATSVSLENTLGVAPTVATTAGAHVAGPFPTGTAVVVTVQNTANALCYTSSAPMINAPCAIVDCGPTVYTVCYGDNEWLQWAYQGADGQEVGIRFLGGTIGYGDDAAIYNGIDPFISGSTDLNSNLMNQMVTSGTPSDDRTLVLELISDASHSCADNESMYGNSVEWQYVVACYDGCVQPKATFSTSCISPTEYEVLVNLSEVGNTGSVAITNNAGVASVTASTTGIHTVGPFTTGTPVTLQVEGASILCTWTSPIFNPNCTSFGVADGLNGSLVLFPNPNNGRFTLELPASFSGRSSLRVTDLAGRVVHEAMLSGIGRVQLEVEGLSNGLYNLMLFSGERVYSGKLSIQN